MDMLVTTVAFLAITLLSIWWHMRRNARRGRAGAAAYRPCPRCAARIPESAAECPSCGVPLSAYELVTAPEAAPGAGAGAGPAEGGRPHAIVRADTCVGCAACVAVCPEPGAIRLEGKMAVVDLNRCMGHAECAKACPTGAIVIASGAAVQRLEVPSVSPHFETNVFGLYVVGELGGRGLIKNAINEGRIAMEHVVQRARGGTDARPSATGAGAAGAGAAGVHDVVVVGSGPAGLSAGLTAHEAGISYLVLEQGSLSDTIHRYPRHKLLLAEPVHVPMYGSLWVADTSKESLLQVWQTIIQKTGLRVHTGCRVSEVVKRDGLFEVQAEDGVYLARSVVLAMGRRGTPRRLGVPGEELPRVFYDIVEMEAFAGSRLLVVGGGDSAVEAAVGLANQKGTEVTLSYRGDAFPRVKERNRQKIERDIAGGRVRACFRSQVREIRPDSVLLETDGRTEALPNDYVIIRIGGEAPHEFLRRAGVRIVEKELAIAEGRAVVAA